MDQSGLLAMLPPSVSMDVEIGPPILVATPVGIIPMSAQRLFTRVSAPMLCILLAASMLVPAPALADGRHMSLVGTLAPWEAGQFSNVAVDATRGVAYVGSWDHQGVAVIDTRDPGHPALTDHLSTFIA